MILSPAGFKDPARSLRIFRDLQRAAKEYFYSPLDGMLVHRRVTPSIRFAGTHLYTTVERGTVTVKRFAQEHNVPGQGSNTDRSIRRQVH